MGREVPLPSARKTCSITNKEISEYLVVYLQALGRASKLRKTALTWWKVAFSKRYILGGEYTNARSLSRGSGLSPQSLSFLRIRNFNLNR